MFKLIDQVECPLLGEDKQPRSYSEDVILFTPNLVALADGITPKTHEERWLNKYSSDPEWFAKTIIYGLEEVSKTREQTGLDDVNEILRLAIEKAIGEFNPVRPIDKIDKPATSLSLLIQHMQDENKCTLVNIGSNYMFYGDKMIGPAPTLREMYKAFEGELKEKAGKGFYQKDKNYYRELRTKKFSTNTERGYSIVDLSYDCINHPETQIQTVNMVKGEKIMLISDGITRCLRLYKNYTEENLFENCLGKGLQMVLDECRAIEVEDWDRRKYPRFMATMDASAMICEKI